jgi:hypothetical protein
MSCRLGPQSSRNSFPNHGLPDQNSDIQS